MRQKIVDEATPLLLALTQYGALADEEIEALRKLTSSTRRLPAGIDLLEQGERGKSSYLILDGWTYSYKDLEDGRRQIVSFQIPGDFLGLRSILLRTADYSSATLTDCRVALVPSAEWERLVADHPRLCAAVLWLMAREGAMLVEPTETETMQTLDELVEAMRAISREAHEDPETVKTAPHQTRLRRLDETSAARNPVLRWE